MSDCSFEDLFDFHEYEWTPEEHYDLLVMLKDGKDIEYISKILGVELDHVLSRRIGILAMHADESSIEEAARVFHTDLATVQKAVDWLQNVREEGMNKNATKWFLMIDEIDDLDILLRLQDKIEDRIIEVCNVHS